MFDKEKQILSAWAQELCAQKNLELFDFDIQRRNKTIAVVVTIDHVFGGVTVDECAFVNRELAARLDLDPVLPGEYTIEVSSPGLDRPLKTEKDFLRVRGADVHFYLKEDLEGKKEYMAKVVEVPPQQNSVKVQLKDSELIIPLNIVNKAVLII